jgi:hypothetical protein
MSTPELHDLHTPSGLSTLNWQSQAPAGCSTPSSSFQHAAQGIGGTSGSADNIFRDGGKDSGDNDENIPPHIGTVHCAREPLADRAVDPKTQYTCCDFTQALLRRARRRSRERLQSKIERADFDIERAQSPPVPFPRLTWLVCLVSLPCPVSPCTHRAASRKWATESWK